MRTDRERDALLAKARETNVERDEFDREAGWGVPSEGPLGGHVSTVRSALICGIDTEDWDCVAEAAAMCEEIMDRLGFAWRAQEAATDAVAEKIVTWAAESGRLPNDATPEDRT